MKVRMRLKRPRSLNYSKIIPGTPNKLHTNR